MTTPPSDPTPPGPPIPPTPSAGEPPDGPWAAWAAGSRGQGAWHEHGYQDPWHRDEYQDPWHPSGRPSVYPDPPSKKMAGWALGLAIVPCCGGITTLVGIGLAIAVLVRSRDGRNHGKGMAIAALVIAPLWIIAGVVLGVVIALDDATKDADRDAAGRVTDRSTISVLRLREGDCFDQDAMADPGDGPVQTEDAEVMPCSEPHQFEVYLVIDLPDGDYPGEDKVSRFAGRRCLAAFADFVGTPYGKSRLEPYVLYPQAVPWRVLHDRSVTCFVGEPGRLTTGTLAGSRR